MHVSVPEVLVHRRKASNGTIIGGQERRDDRRARRLLLEELLCLWRKRRRRIEARGDADGGPGNAGRVHAQVDPVVCTYRDPSRAKGASRGGVDLVSDRVKGRLAGTAYRGSFQRLELRRIGEAEVGLDLARGLVFRNQ